ncbi:MULTISPECIES: alpha/beta hydrolase [unclassified Streptomyces]|uniref:alpha/beta fold hydrolase n=1 Tax=unclassified Streptomyces TaxID=2593676 RepID=UPI000B50901C|nr:MULTISPECIES: alpha/beta hydrolase [unclassified Streptomyces]MYX04771.1 alpha/beta fold hydrolase [Streptomyces sp. SID8378]PVC99699.1 alpha/beta hydrolase [Streptomyces sp. CS147]SNB89357.1 Pimeloyl-ACP methyl ester carboxylesterase [Streptomyces sp. PgraA7]
MERTIQKRFPVGDGSWVTVDVYGEPDAPGLVVVPGAMSDALGWRAVATAVGAWPSVAVVNRRGRAPSGPMTAAYSLRTEVADLGVVLDRLGGARTLFGWSYGGLIALLAADERPLRQVIAYEPVIRPFGLDVLPDLKAADEAADRDAVVEIVHRRIAGLDEGAVDALRADPEVWEALRRLAAPVYVETAALYGEPAPDSLARRADRVDLIVGGANRGTAPYGTSFDGVAGRVPRAGIHELPGQGHMAHLQAPAELARLLEALAVAG